jgi:ABC-2 type transport system ATP-binding protein
VSIEVKGVSKLYGSQKALDNISFNVSKGEILGFLGPNGAGKSTMMKILTTYIPPSAGEVRVAGFDCLSQSMDVRRNVGYLPEHNPLYLEMYVTEYLGFIAGLHHLKQKDKRIAEMISVTGLEIEKHKKIGALSKGYRQRVGLAQALIHDPAVLILDEPTTGLDPNQIAEIRELIRKIGKEKTLMFSTHIMQEVEAICDRVIIINQGSIVAEGKTSEISQSQAKGFTILVEFDRLPNIHDFRAIAGVTGIRQTAENTIEITAEGEQDIRPDIFKMAVEKNTTVLTINRKELKLEELFQKLTKN